MMKQDLIRMVEFVDREAINFSFRPLIEDYYGNMDVIRSAYLNGSQLTIGYYDIETDDIEQVTCGYFSKVLEKRYFESEDERPDFSSLSRYVDRERILNEAMKQQDTYLMNDVMLGYVKNSDCDEKGSGFIEIMMKNGIKYTVILLTKKIEEFLKPRENINRAVVKWFSDERGYGFLTDVKTGKEIFVHYSGISSNEKRKTLEEYQDVTYEIQETEKGKQAINVTVIEH